MSSAQRNDVSLGGEGIAPLPHCVYWVSAAVFLVALIVRLVPAGLSLYVTPDEPIWVYRSARFLQVLRGSDSSLFPETGHPGVTTMGLGALGIQSMLWLRPAEAQLHWRWILSLGNLAPENAVAMRHLSYFLPAGRAVVALVTSAGLVVLYFLGRGVLGERTARLLSLILALDPFLLGHSGVLHTDALQATLVLLSAFSILRVFSPDRRLRGWPALVLASLLLALAGLTKTLGLLAAPGIALLLLMEGHGNWMRRVGAVVAFGLLTTCFFLGGYPPVWWRGWQGILPLIEALRYHESLGLRPVFFMGRMRANAGPFFYPVVLILRMSAPMALGLVGAGVRSWRGGERIPRAALRLVGPALLYLLGLTLGTKKFDRYALTAVLLLAPLAASYWAGAWGTGRRTLAACLLLPWALTAVTPFLAADPLLGGPWLARKIIPLGWGEAAGLGAHKLKVEGRSIASTLMVANVPGAAGIFQGEVWPWEDERLGCTEFLLTGDGVPEGYVPLDEVTAAGLRLATVFVRVPTASLNAPALAPGPLPGVSGDLLWPLSGDLRRPGWLAEHLPVGTPFQWLHAARCYPLTEAELRRMLAQAVDSGAVRCRPSEPVAGFPVDECVLQRERWPQSRPMARFGGRLDLQAAYWPDVIQAPAPLNVSLRWIPVEALPELDVYLALRAARDPAHVVWAEGGQRLLSAVEWVPSAWPSNVATDAKAAMVLPPALAPGRYEFFLGISGPEGWWGITNSDGSFGGTQFRLGMVDVEPARSPTAQLSLPESVSQDWPGLHVLGLQPPSGTVLGGEYLTFALGLERVAGTPPGSLTWHMTCQGGEESTGSLTWGPTRPESWPQGHRYVVPFSVRVPPETSEGRCHLSLSPGDPGAGSLVLSVGEFMVRQRPRDFSQVTPEIRTSVRVDDLAELIGGDWEKEGIAAGGTLPVTLYWRVTATAATNLTVFVHLIDGDERIWAQSDAWPMQGQAPTLTWLPGELIVDTHLLALPADMPAGTYRLYVGLYDAFQGDRMALYQGNVRLDQDRAFLGTLQVRR